jgi:hypothetical protein
MTTETSPAVATRNRQRIIPAALKFELEDTAACMEALGRLIERLCEEADQ